MHYRRLIYMAIKELATQQEQVIIVTSCLMKDMNGKVDLYRANAIRVLARIVDASMMGTVERFLKQAIVDQNPFIASSALLAGAVLNKASPLSPVPTGLLVLAAVRSRPLTCRSCSCAADCS